MMRQARIEDIERLLEIEKECFKSPWSKEDFIYELTQNPYSNVWVLEKGEKIIAYYDLWLIFEQADLANIAVASAYQGKGYGNILIQHAQQQAQNAGCEVIGLEVRVNNEKAITLYKKHGFTIINVRKGYYEEDGQHIDGYRMMKGI